MVADIKSIWSTDTECKKCGTKHHINEAHILCERRRVVASMQVIGGNHTTYKYASILFHNCERCGSEIQVSQVPEIIRKERGWIPAELDESTVRPHRGWGR